MFNREDFRDLCNKAAKERDLSELVVLEDRMSAMLAEQREDNSHDINLD
jgi:hypothetical protein